MYRLCDTGGPSKSSSILEILWRRGNKAKTEIAAHWGRSSSPVMSRFSKTLNFSRNIPDRMGRYLHVYAHHDAHSGLFTLGVSALPSLYPDLHEGPCLHPPVSKALGSLYLQAQSPLHCPGTGLS